MSSTPEVAKDTDGEILRGKCGDVQEMSGQVLIRAKQVEVALLGEPSGGQSGAAAVAVQGLIGNTIDGLFGVNNNLTETLGVLDRIYQQIK